MKNYIFIIWCSTVFLLCVSMSGFCMEMEVELSAQQYFKVREKIDAHYDQKLKTLILSVTEDNALEKINKIEHKLHIHGQTIEKEKNIFFYRIKQQYDISDDVWSVVKIITEKVHEFRQGNMWQSREDVIHDPLMPQWFMAILKKQLVKAGCNPQAINICNTGKSSFSVYGADIDWSYKGVDDVFHKKLRKPGKILLNSKDLDFFIDNLEAAKGQCIFLAQNMRIYRSFDVLSIASGFNIDIKKKEWSYLVDTLCQLHYLLVGALKSSRSAHCLKSFLKIYVSNLSTKENYKQLSSIDFCWKVLEWLKKYYTINHHCVPLLFFVKNKYSAEAKYLLDKGMVITKNIVEKAENNFILKNELQNFYDEQQCCVCFEHPEDMRDMPCKNRHVKNFICRGCYNKLAYNGLNQRICPLCLAGCFSYNNTTDYQ